MIGVILAGGRSQRMRRDKALLKIGDARLIDIVYQRLKHQCDEVIISGEQDYDLGLEAVADNPHGPGGPVGALFTLWKLLAVTEEIGFCTVPVDSPDFPMDLCQRLYGDKSAIAVSPETMHQAFAWWRISDLSAAFSHLDVTQSLSLKMIANMCQARHVEWSDESLFYNINTPNDLNRYLTQKTAQDTSKNK